MIHSNDSGAWLVAGLRTPFAKIDGPFRRLDAIELSVHVVQAMIRSGEDEVRPDLAVWGTVVPNLAYSNIAREILIDAGLDATIPAFSTVLACSTSMVGVFEAAGMLGVGGRELALVGGAESMSRVQTGIGQNLSDVLRRFAQARSLTDRLRSLGELKFRDLRLHVPSVRNRATGKTMGEHTEEMAKSWAIPREDQDRLALRSHKRAVAGQASQFFDDLVVPLEGISKDLLPRADTRLEKLATLRPVFDTTSGLGTLTAGNSSPLTDGAAGIWVATEEGLKRLSSDLPRVRLVDWEMAAVDIRTEGLLMAPAYAIPRLLTRQGLTYEDVDLWEIHEAFAAQVLSNIAALESKEFLTERVRIDARFGSFPWERVNPNGGSIALGHPFGATGARILSQATKELSLRAPGSRAIVSICADGGLGTVALLEAV